MNEEEMESDRIRSFHDFTEDGRVFDLIVDGIFRVERVDVDEGGTWDI